MLALRGLRFSVVGSRLSRSHRPGTIFPKITGSSAPVTLGMLLAIPWIVAYARMANETASLASTLMPNSSVERILTPSSLLLQHPHERRVVRARRRRGSSHPAWRGRNLR